MALCFFPLPLFRLEKNRTTHMKTRILLITTAVEPSRDRRPGAGASRATRYSILPDRTPRNNRGFRRVS
jgi:hypothetical protein